MLLYLMNNDTADIFAPVKTKLKVTSQMDNGQYEINWIDIRTGKTISSEKLSKIPAEITSPEFKDGLFAYIKKI
jgi:hypothetical protein